MPQESGLSTGGFVARASFFYAAICLVIGVQMPVFPVWLEAKGLDPKEIGLVLAAPSLMRIFAVPALARIADRSNAVREVLMICAVAAAFGYAGIGLAQGGLALLLAVALTSIPNTSAMALLDAYALTGLKARQRAYGPVRLWGSAAFIAANVTAGWLLDVIAPSNLIWIIVAAAAFAALSAFTLAPLDAVPVAEREPARAAIWRKPAFLTIVAAASLIQASHAVYYGFSTIDWKAAGFGGLTIGLLWALGIIAEILLFAWSGRAPPWLHPSNLILVGALGATLRWAMMAFDPPAWSLPALQCLHALSFGATHLGTLGLLSRLAVAGQSATAQGFYAAIFGIIFAGAMALSGLLYGAYGSAAYGAMALIAAAGGLIALIAQRSWLAEMRQIDR
jgi:PPP family 3-phenylpropionic acid transporter